MLGHRQGDAVDVDLLEGVLADQRGGDVAGDRDHRDRVEEGGPDPGHEVGGARSGRSHADPDLARDAGIAVGGVGAALLVPDQDVTELRIVAKDVVERKDHPARVAEEDVDTLEEERLADDVRPDPSTVPRPRVVEHRPAGGFDGCGVCRAIGRDVAAPFRPGFGLAWRCRRLPLRHRHRSCLPSRLPAWPGDPPIAARAAVDGSFMASKNPRHPARVPSVDGGRFAVSARSSAYLRSPAGSR